MSLTVQHWKTQYRVEDRTVAQRTSNLDRQVRTEVAPRVQARIDELFDQLGLGPNAVVFVDALRLRLVVSEKVAAKALHMGWADAVERAIVHRVKQGASTHAFGSGDDSQATLDAGVLCFENKAQVLRRWLLATVSGSRPWWNDLLWRGRDAKVEEALASFVDLSPEGTASLLTSLATTVGGYTGLLRWIKPTQALRLHHQLLELQHQGAQGIGVAFVESRGDKDGESADGWMPTQSNRSSFQEHLAGSPSALRSFVGPSDALADWVLAGWAAQRPGWGWLSPRVIRALVRPGNAASVDRAADRAKYRAGKSSLVVSSKSENRPKEVTRTSRPGSAERSQDEAQPELSQAAAQEAPEDLHEKSSRERAAPELETGGWHWVKCAGILFLLRPLLRGPWMEPSLRCDLAERLYAFGAILLAELLRPLSDSERELAWERESPLLLVLSGMSSEPAPCIGEGRASIHAEIDRLEAELPDGLKARGASLRGLLGANAWPLPQFRWPKLAAIALRSGALCYQEYRVDLNLGLSEIDLNIRRLGLDIDPGWVPWIGRSIRFLYHDESSALWRSKGGEC